MSFQKFAHSLHGHAGPAIAAISPVYHAYTIWLFTYSDLKSIVGPETAFGVLSALSGPILSTNQSPSTLAILSRIPKVAYWVWINLLIFVIGNQRKQKAIEEDGENKPWRPMPAKRLTQTQANYFLIAAHIAALMSSLYIGGLKQCIALILLDYWYNDLEGGDKSWFLRSFINACGFSCYASGATEIASGYPGFPLNDTANQWFLIIGMIVFSTIQSMDIYDQVGDRLRGRRTIPLILGDSAARWTLAIPVAIWSFFCPFFWRLPVGGYLGSTLFGGVIIYRTLNKRTTKDDRMTFSIWNLWMVVLYLSPLFKRMEGFDNLTGTPETRLFGYI